MTIKGITIKKKMLFDADYNYIKIVTNWFLDRKVVTLEDLI